LLDLLYPPLCIGCAARLAPEAAPLCPRCIAGLERPEAPYLAAVLNDLCGVNDALDGGFALWMFDKGGTLQRAQHALKYGNYPAYGPPLGALVGRAYLGAGLPVPDAVVPIPLHRLRLYERGYNQSERLAAGLAETLGVLLSADRLERPHPTRTQTNLTRQQRWDNVKSAFSLSAPGAVRGKHLLLVDDVLTTGATAAAAADVLKAAGARHVSLAVLALARH
jgi:ComF family protein